MGLPEIYEKYFGAKEAADKKAEGEEAAPAAEAPAAEAPATETASAQAEVSDEDLEKALGEMSEDDLKALAVEVAGDVKASQAKEQAEAEKVAEEYYAAGRIFAQGFMAEVKGGEKTAEPEKKVEEAPNTATQKFAGLLKAEIEKGAEKAPEKK